MILVNTEIVLALDQKHVEGNIFQSNQTPGQNAPKTQFLGTGMLNYL